MFGVIVVLCISFFILVLVTLISSVYNQKQNNAYKFQKDLEFPEQLFGAENTLPYYTRVIQGIDFMKDRSMVFTGLARDIKDVMKLNVDRLKLLGKSFKNYKIVIFENNSTDGTKGILSRLQDDDPEHVIVLSEDSWDKSAVSFGKHHIKRFERMATFRNIYVNYIREHLQGYNYVTVVDLDLKVGISGEGLAHCFSYKDTWDVITCNGVNMHNFKYYDPLAYISKDGSRIIGHSGEKKGTIPNSLKFTKGDENIIPIKSAFSGAAIYRFDTFVAGQYSGEDCEHVCFHKSIREAGFTRMFLNPNFMVIR